MKSTLLALTGVLLVIFSVLSCQKELSSETNISAGSLKSADGNCLPFIVNGIYNKDSILSSANYIDVKVNITIPGNYLIQTDSSDGFSFLGAGNVDSVGSNTIRLFAKGKPSNAGNFTFHIAYDSSSCPVNVTVTNSASANATYTVTNASGACPTVNFTGVYKVDLNLDASNTMDFDVDVTKLGAYSFNFPTVDGISFAGSGNFTSIGTQHVTLKGLGKPIAAGSFSFSLATCNFPLTVLTAGSTPDAKYTIVCTGTQLSGTYTQGTAMNNSNTIKISATVTTPGKYSITSTSVNGVIFSANGNFTSASTTPQSITLSATGTPTTKGSFDYPITGNGNTCTITVPYTGLAIAATFTLTGGPSACTSAVVNGTYSAGITLDATNTVILNVDVTIPGSYVVTTDNINGMTFSATGTLLNAGQQTITLTGSGTPTNATASIFTPKIGLSSCTFNINVAAAHVIAGIFTCKIDGVFTTFNEQANFSNLGLGGKLTLSLEGYTIPVNGASRTKMELFIDNNDGTAVKAGSYNVDALLLPNGYNIEVDYTLVDADQSAVIWNTSSSFLSKNPPFTIVITSISNDRVKGTFSGKVTNVLQGSTQTKTITEGVFDLPKQ